jgi:tetratricopeptide (TPR) repeat protein
VAVACGAPAPEESPVGEMAGGQAPAGAPGEAVRPFADALTQGMTFLRQGRYAEAIEVLESGHQQNPDDAGMAFFLGRALHADTKLGKAEAAYRAALKADPGLAEGWLHLSEIYLEQGRLPEALDCLQSLGRSRGRGPALDYQEGFVLSKMGRFQEAEQMLQRSLQVQPDNPHAWYIYGVTAQRAGDDVKAVEAFQRALRLDATYADAWFNIGNALARLGRIQEAQDALQRFAAVNVAREVAASTASNLRVLRRGAEMDLEQGELELVEIQIREAEKVRPAEPWVQRLWGELALARGDGPAALERLGRSAALNSGDPDEQLALAAAFEKAGDTDAANRHRREAERLFQTGLERRP